MAYVFNDGTGATTNLIGVNTHDILYRLKQLLKAVGWTVVASSNGTTFSNVGDVIASAADLNVNNAWFVIQQPQYSTGVGAPGGRMFGFRRSTTANNWTVGYYPLSASNLPQVASTPGALALLPVYPIQQSLIGSLPTTAASWFGSPTSRAWNLCAENTAPYSFYQFGWRTASNILNPDEGGVAVFDGLERDTFAVGDPDPYVTYFLISGSNAFEYAGIGSSVSGEHTRGYLGKGTAGEYFGALQAAFWAQAATPGITPSSVTGCGGMDMYGRKHVLSPITYVNPGNSSNTTNPSAPKGASSMIRWFGTLVTSGFTYTLRTTRDRITVADCVLPWDGSVPTIV